MSLAARLPSLGSRPGHLRRRSRSAAPRLAVSAALGLGAPNVRVPLNLYSALGVAPRSPAGAVDYALAERTSSPPTASLELSDGALSSRAQLLALAGGTLASLSRRSAYDAALAAGAADIDVPLHALPGALLLLQEAGDLSSALRLGTAALQARPHSTRPALPAV